MADHQPVRPSWDCETCGAPWPCGPAQTRMLAETPSPTALRMRMWNTVENAAFDLPQAAPARLFERFLRWTG